jgi:hypothetical protein
VCVEPTHWHGGLHGAIGGSERSTWDMYYTLEHANI